MRSKPVGLTHRVDGTRVLVAAASALTVGWVVLRQRARRRASDGPKRTHATGTTSTAMTSEVEGWHAVLESRSVRGQPVGIQRFGRSLVLFRGRDGGVGCLDDHCPHRSARLSGGQVVGNKIACELHGFQFDREGQCVLTPCDGPSARPRGRLAASAYVVREAHGLVWLYWGRIDDPTLLPGIPWFDEVPTTTKAAHDGAYRWPIPVDRAVESNFDVYHGATVHGRRSLRFTRIKKLTVATDIACRTSDDEIDYRVVLREAEPSSSRRRGRRANLPARIRLRAPAVTFVEVGRWIKILVCDTPIDADTTWRFTRRLSPVGHCGGLGRPATALLASLERVVQFREDLPVMASQGPVGAGEVFLKADIGSREYLRLRRVRMWPARGTPSRSPRRVVDPGGSEAHRPAARDPKTGSIGQQRCWPQGSPAASELAGVSPLTAP